MFACLLVCDVCCVGCVLLIMSWLLFVMRCWRVEYCRCLLLVVACFGCALFAVMRAVRCLLIVDCYAPFVGAYCCFVVVCVVCYSLCVACC